MDKVSTEFKTLYIYDIGAKATGARQSAQLPTTTLLEEFMNTLKYYNELDNVDVLDASYNPDSASLTISTN
jgi:hypothetical protein